MQERYDILIHFIILPVTQTFDGLRAHFPSHLFLQTQMRGPYVWQVHGDNPHYKGSCFCGRNDDYCMCTPSLAIDCVLEYHETKDGPVTGMVFVKRKDGKGMAVVGGFVQLGK